MSKTRKKKREKFKHLDQNDRDRIQALIRKGHTQVEIAEILKVDESTISREIRNRKRKNNIYDAGTAQHKASVKRLRSKYQGMKIESNSELRKYITSELKQRRSPDEISGRMKKDRLPFYASKDAIYKWLYSAYGQKYCKYLCTKRCKKREYAKDKPKRSIIPDKISVFERPQSIGLIHGEGDTIVSPKKAQTTASIAVVCVSRAKYLCGSKIPSLKPKNMKKAVTKINDQIQLDTLTLDNGIENRLHKQFGVPTYFCDAHSPWQKPYIENGILLARRWEIPKKTDLSKISERKLQRCFDFLNHKYRKSLGYKSAYEVAVELGILKGDIKEKSNLKSCI